MQSEQLIHRNHTVTVAVTMTVQSAKSMIVLTISKQQYFTTIRPLQLINKPWQTWQYV